MAKLVKQKPLLPLKIILAAAGFISLALGCLGIFLPLLPTTPFLILAAACFARSSPGLHRWLLQRPRLGPMIVDWELHGVIRPRAKISATAMLAGAMAISALLTGRAEIIAVLCLISVAVLGFIWSRPGSAVYEKQLGAAAEAHSGLSCRAATAGRGRRASAE